QEVQRQRAVEVRDVRVAPGVDDHQRDDHGDLGRDQPATPPGLGVRGVGDLLRRAVKDRCAHQRSLASTSSRSCLAAMTRSSTTEVRISAPTTACCQKSEMPRIGSARLMVISRKPPIAAPQTVPLPPKIATPPITAAATACSSKP